MEQKKIIYMTNLLEGKSQKEAVKIAGISRATGNRWQKEPEFQKEFERRKVEMLENVSMFLRNSLFKCCEKLIEIVNDSETSAQVKINAISLIIQSSKTFTEQTEILERIVRLEQEMKEGQQE